MNEVDEFDDLIRSIESFMGFDYRDSFSEEAKHPRPRWLKILKRISELAKEGRDCDGSC